MTEDTNNLPVGSLRVWWVPQVPRKKFIVPVKDTSEAIKIMDVLADYDLFQYENRIKPDYCNAGGLEVVELVEDDKDNLIPEWCEWYDHDTGDDIDDLKARLTESAEE